MLHQYCDLSKHFVFYGTREHQGQSYLHWASMNGMFEVVRVIVEHGTDLYLKDKESRTALDIVGINIDSECAMMMTTKYKH